jgi:hypothetical protein
MTTFGAPRRFAAATLLIAAVAAAGIAAPAVLAAEASPPARAAQLQQLLDCRKLTDATQRLACFDQAAGVLDQAEAKGDVVVVDREQARKVRRQAFGFTMPSMSLFSRGEKPEEITSADGVIASARKLNTGKWEVTLADGARWVQIDSTEIPLDPKPGQKVKIKTAAMGSYLMSVNNQRDVKMHREQ